MEGICTRRNKPDNRTGRRGFLRKAGAVAAFAIVPRHVLGGRGRVRPSEKVNVAFVGCGGQSPGGGDMVDVE